MFGRNRNERNDRNNQDRSQNFQGQNYQGQDYQSDYSRGEYRNESDRGYDSPYSQQEYGEKSYEGRSGRFGSSESERYGSRSDSPRFTSEDRTFSMNDRNYESPYSQRTDWNRPSYGSTYGSSYRGQPGLGSQGSTNQSGSGYRGYQDYGSSYQPQGSRQNSQSSSRQDRGFFGKGPKGYKRSDDKIYDEVCDVLTTHYDIDASEIEVEVKDGTVTLTGTVEDRHTKRMAEDVVADMNGVQDVRNNLRVLSHDSRLLESSSDGGKSNYRSASASTDSTLGSRSSKASSSSSTTRQ